MKRKLKAALMKVFFFGILLVMMFGISYATALLLTAIIK